MVCSPERVDHVQSLKSTKISVTRNELRDAVLQAKACYMGIVDKVPGCSRPFYNLVHHYSMLARLRQQNEIRRIQKTLQVVECTVHGNWRMVDARMCHHTKELVDARPRYCPGAVTFRQFGQQTQCGAMMGA